MAMDNNSSSAGDTIMAALIGLSPRRFSDLTRSLSSDLRLRNHRLAFLLLSPHHFSTTLSYLHSLSLSEKTLLLARFLLRSLSMLIISPSSSSSSAGHRHSTTTTTSMCTTLRYRELDAGLLLLAMCEVYDRDEGNVADWRAKIAGYLVDRTLSTEGLGAQGWGVVSRYVDASVKCRRLLEVVSNGNYRGAREAKTGSDVAASVAAVVSLPSVECEKTGWECVVCKEEIEMGRDVCVLPCDHGFHWGCILPWLRKRNTCPSCRFELPTDDVFCEIERVWRAAVKMGTGKMISY